MGEGPALPQTPDCRVEAAFPRIPTPVWPPRGKGELQTRGRAEPSPGPPFAAARLPRVGTFPKPRVAASRRLPADPLDRRRKEGVLLSSGSGSPCPRTAAARPGGAPPCQVSEPTGPRPPGRPCLHAAHRAFPIARRPPRLRRGAVSRRAPVLRTIGAPPRSERPGLRTTISPLAVGGRGFRARRVTESRSPPDTEERRQPLARSSALPARKCRRAPGLGKGHGSRAATPGFAVCRPKATRPLERPDGAEAPDPPPPARTLAFRTYTLAGRDGLSSPCAP